MAVYPQLSLLRLHGDMMWGLNGPYGPRNSARVDISTPSNATWTDAFQFDPPPGTTGYCWGGYTYPGIGGTGPAWNFSGQNFRVDIKGNAGQQLPLLSVDNGVSGSSLIIVDDYANRILHFNVSEAVLSGATAATGATGTGLIPGDYVYDFVMYDNSSPPIRVVLMNGKFVVTNGITGG